MKKLIILVLACLLSGCSTSNRSTSQMKHSSSSSITQRFILKKDSNSQKRLVKRIINGYRQYGLTVVVSTFNDGYSVHLQNHSLLQDIRDSDQNGFLKKTIIPVTQEVSAQTHTKIYFNADDPNLELIVTANNGQLEYTINLTH